MPDQLLDCSLVEHQSVGSQGEPSHLTDELVARLRDLRHQQRMSARKLADRCAQLGMPNLTRSTIAKMCLVLAPRAMRTPISCERFPTANDSSP